MQALNGPPGKASGRPTPMRAVGIASRSFGTANRVGLGSGGQRAVGEQGSAGTDMVNNPNEPRRPQRRQQGRSDSGGRDTEVGMTRETPLRGRPANENEPVSAAMIAGLRRRPSNTPFFIAFGLTLLWTFLWFWSFSAAVLENPNPLSTQAMPQTMIASSILVIPLALIWAVAWIMWRAQQLRQVSEVLVQTAMRLVRPQDRRACLHRPGSAFRSRHHCRRRRACGAARFRARRHGA
jgi:hypothetical protein